MSNSIQVPSSLFLEKSIATVTSQENETEGIEVTAIRYDHRSDAVTLRIRRFNDFSFEVVMPNADATTLAVNLIAACAVEIIKED